MKIGDYYDLKENNKDLVLTIEKDKSGHDGNQKFYKEEVKWIVLDIREGKIILVADKPLKQQLTLKGEIGFKNSIELLDEICRKVTGEENVRSINEEDLIKSEWWKDKKKENIILAKTKDDYYWLASRSSSVGSTSYESWGLRYVGYGYVTDYYLFYSNGSTDNYSFGVRPIIEIEQD